MLFQAGKEMIRYRHAEGGVTPVALRAPSITPPLIKQLHPCNDSCRFPNTRGTTNARFGIFFMATNTVLRRWSCLIPPLLMRISVCWAKALSVVQGQQGCMDVTGKAFRGGSWGG